MLQLSLSLEWRCPGVPVLAGVGERWLGVTVGVCTGLWVGVLLGATVGVRSCGVMVRVAVAGTRVCVGVGEGLGVSASARVGCAVFANATVAAIAIANRTPRFSTLPSVMVSPPFIFSTHTSITTIFHALPGQLLFKQLELCGSTVSANATRRHGLRGGHIGSGRVASWSVCGSCAWRPA